MVSSTAIGSARPNSPKSARAMRNPAKSPFSSATSDIRMADLVSTSAAFRLR